MSLRRYHILVILNRANKAFAPRTLNSACKSQQTKCVNFCNGDHGVRNLHTRSTVHSIFKNSAKERAIPDFPDYGQPLDSWNYDVNKYGKVIVNSPMSIHVQPLDAQKYPTMDKVFLNVLYIGQEKLSNQQLSALTKNYIVNVNLDDKNEEIDVSIKYKNSNVHLACQCHLQIPLKYDVAVSCKDDGDASLENLEGEQISVRTHQGHCYFKGIKGGTVDVKTKGGGIISRSLLQGNLNLVAQGEGGISAGRLQGQTVKCVTEAGDVSVKAVYAEKSQFDSESGNVQLGNCHGTADVRLTEGDLIIDTMDGNLTGEVTMGDSSVYVAREGEANLASKTGNVMVRVPDGLNSEVCLVGSEVRTDKVTLHQKQEDSEEHLAKVQGNLSGSGSSKGMIQVSTGGVVKLKYQDWFSAINFNKE